MEDELCSADPYCRWFRGENPQRDSVDNLQQFSCQISNPTGLPKGHDILDVEQAVLTGQVVRTEKDDPRGSKYVIEGLATDGKTSVGVVGRFQGNGHYVIITIYEVIKDE
jgi:hypothetical protein